MGELTRDPQILDWVRDMAALCLPDRIRWCDGSDREKAELEAEAVHLGVILPLDPVKHPGSFYSRSDRNDVARVEQLTFICTRSKEDAGPTNNWMEPGAAYAKARDIFRGSMKGRTMFVVPFLMGPPGSPLSKVGIQLTDSIYVVLNMRIMTRMGEVALREFERKRVFTRCLHGTADLNPDRRYILHFPEDNTIWSVGSAYGGNALLGKKCLALRIGSYLGHREGWMAEHMLILGIRNPEGRTHFVTAAFPSQCGKTNFAMLVPPPSFKGYEVFTVGDDIAWLHVGEDGRLWAINPEAGFFGVAPGTGPRTNPVALETVRRNTLFTNVALCDDRTVWWEGLGDPPQAAWDWKGDRWTPESKEKAAHPNSRFTVPVAQCPMVHPDWQNPAGVPISAIIFGGRRARVTPLVYEAPDWRRGVFVGATMASETTAAATGKVGVVRRDPFAMLPFMGYHAGDYIRHWLRMGERITRPPRIFHVDWFRTDENGRSLWPGYGENLRVLDWMIRRVEGRAEAVRTPIGFVPRPEDLNLEGLKISPEDLNALLRVDRGEWLGEIEGQNEFFATIGDRLPEEIRSEQAALRAQLENWR